MTTADESEQVSHIYAVTRSYLGELVEASASSRETDDAFVSLAIQLHGANPDNLSQLLAGAVLRIVAAERNHAEQCEEIARLNAELDLVRAKKSTGVAL